MQRATLLFSFLLLISCTAVRQLANEKVENKYDCLDINLMDKFPLVEVSLDKNSVPFLFDTGAMRSTLIDSLSLPSFKNKKASSLGVIMGADGKKIKNSYKFYKNRIRWVFWWKWCNESSKYQESNIKK